VLIIAIILLGTVAGGIARWLVGKLTGVQFAVSEAFIAGLAGSFVGGLVLSLVTGNGLALTATGILGSALGALIILLVWGYVRGRADSPTR
jgi:uncharacterized membrane protein YeaQ/YmgE (transglycosylase-associated protein family)